jgi:hypothetical protein
MSNLSRLTLRLPEDIKAWTALRAARNAASVNSEIVRLLRAQMDKNSDRRLSKRDQGRRK